MKKIELEVLTEESEQEQREKDAELLRRAKKLEDFMCSSFKEIGLQAFFAGHLMTDMMMGMLWMAHKVSKQMGFEDEKISRLFNSAFRIDLDNILKKYEYHPAVQENPKKKGLL